MAAPEVLAQIIALHNEIITAARTSLEKAVRLGELLTDIKTSLKHGDWLLWMQKNLPFSDQTARNYIRIWEKRDDPKFKTVLNLTDAYRLLSEGDRPSDLIAKLPDAETPHHHRRLGSRLPPKPGECLMGHVSNNFTSYQIDIMPHRQDGYYFVNVISTDAGVIDGPGTLDGTKKAIHKDWVERTVRQLVGDLADSIEWYAAGEMELRWEYNEFMFFSHQAYVDEVILGKPRFPAKPTKKNEVHHAANQP
ncbi:MAG: DUF3102 domain-containing protein [Verrucomicrobiota bacterium]